MKRDFAYDVEPARLSKYETGIPIRARHNGKLGTYDIVHLNRESLHAWLRYRGGENRWAESVVLLLLEHEQLGPEE